MPAYRYLQEFGHQVWHAFGHPPYLVGSALHTRDWRDVDVRLMLPDNEYQALFGDVRHQGLNGKLAAFNMAFSELGHKMTGLPIDFQIQQSTDANRVFQEPREALGVVELRHAR
jgi:hypothetical protein